jgi:hypothetical protein
MLDNSRQCPLQMPLLPKEGQQTWTVQRRLGLGSAVACLLSELLEFDDVWILEYSSNQFVGLCP